MKDSNVMKIFNTSLILFSEICIHCNDRDDCFVDDCDDDNDTDDDNDA